MEGRHLVTKSSSIAPETLSAQADAASPAADAAQAGQPLPAEWWLRVGHDLRGSIAPMRMAVQLLRSGKIADADRHHALQLIDRQIDLLLGSIDDISDLVRLNAGTLAWHAEPNDLNLVLDIISGRSSLLRTLEERRQTLKCLPLDIPVIAEHDPTRLAALLDYLIRKAAEHAAPNASLSLELRKGSGRAHLRIAGAGRDLLADPELQHVLGTGSALAECPEAKPVLMREIARLSKIAFLPMGGKTDICFWLPAARD